MTPDTITQTVLFPDLFDKPLVATFNAGLLRVSASTVYRWEAARGPLALRAGQEDASQVLYREIEKRQTE